MALTTVDGGMLSATNAQYTGFKNRLINGSMLIWQRGTTTVNPQAGNANFYTADRWACNRASNVTGITVSQSTDVPTGFKYSLKLQRTAANTALDALYLFNSNESINTLDLAGQTVTISFWAKAGANYSGGALTIILSTGTGTDQPVYAFTNAAATIATTQAITTTWTRYSFTGTLPSNATEVGSYYYWTPTGTAGADDAVYFTGFQLEKGSTATAFDYRPYTTELQLCQRYYWYWTQGQFGRLCIAYNDATTSLQITFSIPVPLRISNPAIGFSNMTSNGVVITATGVATINGSVWMTASGTGLTVGATQIYVNSGATGLVTLNAEL